MKSSISEYRVGSMGALLDEYEKALGEIQELFRDVSQENFERIMDEKSKDPDCRSMKTIMGHVINAGYGYSFYIRNRDGQEVERIRVKIEKVDTLIPEINKMFEYMISTSESLSIDLGNDKEWQNFLFTVPWGDSYNLEQILEHAIVHVLRHRRQIEKFILMQR
ncbi:MAG: DinB family protein [Candidatus Heimdallarchaeota archaeon]|nr:DinB family protein [Candidatus Heimdallarchaeota archaeon]